MLKFEVTGESQSTAATHTSVATYLDALEKPLASFGAEERQIWRVEAEGHLESLIAAHKELGSSHEEAVAAALRQFGNAQRVGQQTARATRRLQQRISSGETRAFLTPLAAGFAVQIALLAIDLMFMQARPGNTELWRPLTACLFAVFYVSPFAAGWQLGRVATSRQALIRALDPIQTGRSIGLRVVTAAMLFAVVAFIANVMAGAVDPCGQFALLALLWVPIALTGIFCARRSRRAALRRLAS